MGDGRTLALNQATVQVIAAVIQRDSRYLVCRRPPHKRHGDLWEFPGGKLEGQESFLDAAARELLEELELTVTSVGEVEMTIADPGSPFVINFALVQVAGEPVPHEHTAVSWLDLDGLLTLQLAPSDRQFVEYMAAGRH